MAKKPLVVVYDKIYVPIEIVNVKKVEKRFTHVVYEDATCSKCPYLNDRHSYMCDPCAAYIGEIRTYTKIYKDGKDWVGLPLGRKSEVLDYMSVDEWEDVRIRDLRYDTRFDYKIKFGGEKEGQLRDYQLTMANDFLKKKYGIIESPPRSGKTITALYIGVTYGRRMLVIASQKEFLSQFEDHVREFTNLPALEEKHGLKLYGRAKTYKEFKQFQIATATVQTFYSKEGQRLLRKISKFYGNVWMDEVHKSAANIFLKTVSSLPIKMRWGATGTVERKDGRHRMLMDVLGPVVASSTVESMMPIVKTVYTGLKPKHTYKNWTYAMKWLAGNEDRNQLIIDDILADLDRGHSIILPCLFRNHIMEMTRRINAEYGSQIADYFVGGGDKKNLAKRELVLDQAKSGKIRVVVGTRSILQLGLNVPRWSLLYSIFPISNKPNLKQETSRIRTPMDGKKQPEIKFYLDDMNQSLYCYKASIHHCQQFGYNFDQSTYEGSATVSKKLGVKNWLYLPTNKQIIPNKRPNGTIEKINGKLF